MNVEVLCPDLPIGESNYAKYTDCNILGGTFTVFTVFLWFCFLTTYSKAHFVFMLVFSEQNIIISSFCYAKLIFSFFFNFDFLRCVAIFQSQNIFN